MLFLAVCRVFNRIEPLIFIYMGGGVWVELLVGQGACARILVLRECIWIAAAISLALPDILNTGSLGYPSHWVVYPSGSTPGDCLPFRFLE